MIRLNRAICSGDCTGNNPPADPAGSDQAHPPRHCILLSATFFLSDICVHSLLELTAFSISELAIQTLKLKMFTTSQAPSVQSRSSLSNFSSLTWEMLLWMCSSYQVGVRPWLEPWICGSVQPAPAVLMISATVHTLTELHCLEI